MPTAVSARQFKDWAGKDIARWNSLSGQTAVHKKFLEGTANRVYSEPVGIFIVVAYCSELPRIHSAGYFERSFKHVVLDDALAARVSGRQAPIEKSRIEHLRERVKQGEVLQPRDLLWLGTGGHVEELDIYLEKHGSDWPVAKVGRYWRDCGLPERNLDITMKVEANKTHEPSDAAVWTTRGAAFADLFDPDEAERCAQTALTCSPRSFYPHNLLGRVYYFLGQQDLGDRHFEIARTLGSDDRHQDSARRRGQDGRPVDPSDPGSGDSPDDEVPF